MATIRVSKDSDVPRIAGLIRGILRLEFSKDQVAYPADDLKNLSATYHGSNSTFLVAEDESRIVGTCGVKAEDGKTAILRRFFVDPACRGKGVGLALLNEALGFCRKKGFHEVVIRTSTRMESAIRLCTGLGFREEGRWPLGEMTLVRFRLKLTR